MVALARFDALARALSETGVLTHAAAVALDRELALREKLCARLRLDPRREFG